MGNPQDKTPLVEPTIRKRIVGKHLKAMRLESGRSIDEVVTALGVTRPAAYRRETGHTTVSVMYLRKAMALFDVNDREYRSRMEVLTKHCRTKGWWSRYQEDVGPQHADLADAEDLAENIYYSRASGIPALLETDEYTRAILEMGRPSLEHRSISVDHSFDMRQRRKEVIYRKGPPRITAVLGESCVLAKVGSESVMRNQVQHLLDLDDRSDVSIRIFPFSAGVPYGPPGGNVAVLQFHDDVGLAVMVDAVGSFNDDYQTTMLHLEHIQQNQDLALSREDSRKYLENLLETVWS